VDTQVLVCEMANTDGMHIDPELDEGYAVLNGPLPRLVITDVDGERSADGFAEASLRQVAREVERTLDGLKF